MNIIKNITAVSAVSLILGFALLHSSPGMAGNAKASSAMDNSLRHGVPAGVGSDPLSSVIAVYPADSSATVASVIKSKVEKYKRGVLDDPDFPLSAKTTDEVRLIDGLKGNIVVSWLDRITPGGKTFGSNNDYTAYFGDNRAPGAPPQWNGDPNSGRLWVNHEYMSVSLKDKRYASLNHAPNGQWLTFAKHLQARGVIPAGDASSDKYWTQEVVNRYIAMNKKELGASWIKIEKSGGKWIVDQDDQNNERYTGDADTLIAMTGPVAGSFSDHDEKGNPLPQSVVAGTLANCSGGVTPWGTVITGEEGNERYYGDPEPAMPKPGRFYMGKGFDPGAPVNPDYTADPNKVFTASSDKATYHPKIAYGWPTEFDPGQRSTEWLNKTTEGVGHAKHSAFGQAHWENVSFVVDTSWRLPDGKPIVSYMGNDRRGGRVYKFVSAGKYRKGMTKAEARKLLTAGSLYVSHLPGVDVMSGYKMLDTGAAPEKREKRTGQWIELSIDNSRGMAPNAGVSGSFKAMDGTQITYANKTGATVGQALQDVNWNGIGGFDTQAKVLSAPFTASHKIGVFEQNRPEDLEYNPFHKSVFISYTFHSRRVWLDQKGGMVSGDKKYRFPGEKDGKRRDKVGRIWAFEEADTAAPETSRSFTFWQVAGGDPDFCSKKIGFARPDNMAVGKDGELWFSTDYQYAVSDGECGDALHYLDYDPKTGKGTPYRFLTVPSDAEPTGPSFNSNMTALFVSIQHPGESFPSSWPAR